MTGILATLIGQVFSGSAVTADPYFEYTTLLLPGNGTNGAQNNTFLDGSTNNFTITRNGNTTQGTFSPFSQTGWGNYLSGSSQYLTVADSTDFDLTSDYTIELWFYPNVTGGLQRLFMIGDYRATYNGIDLYVNASNQVVFYSNGASIITGGTVTNFQWNHVALVRNGGGANNTTLYINGTSVGQATNTTSFTGVAANGVSIGLEYSGAGTSVTTAMYVSNARLVKGTPVYTSNFTPPTSPLTAITNTVLLTCQSNRFIDTNTQVAAKTITANGSPTVVAFSPFNPTASWSAATYGGSGYFDGSGDQLSAGSNSAFAFGTGAYTVEFWTYLNAAVSSTHQPCFVFNDTTGGFGFWNQDGGGLVISGRATAPNIITTNVNLVPYQWNHVAAVRVSTSSNQLFVFVNGLLIGTGTDATNWSVTGPLQIGGISLTNYYLNGFVSNLRVIKGAAVYTGAFTPPIAPLSTSGSASASAYPSTTNVNTSFASSTCSLLTNFTNAGIYDATSKNDLETVGNAQISTAQSKWGGSSMAFDGTGDYLVMPSSVNLAFGTGDFTLEMWAYFTSVANFPTLTDSRVSGSSTTGFNLGLSSAKLQLYTNTSLLLGATTLSINTWYYIAVSRESGALKIFLDGSQDASTSNSTNWSDTTFIVGAGPSGANPMTGYIQDLRVTKGKARTITTPTAAFPTL